MVLTNQSCCRAAALLVLGLTVIAPAAARVTCCTIDGKRSCGDPPPAQCIDKAKTVITKGVTKEIEAPLTVEQREARDAEVTRKIEEEKKVAEQMRRDRALMASYSSEKDIDKARDRAVAEIEKNSGDAKTRLETALKNKVLLDQEKEFFQKKPMPAKLESQLKENEKEIAAQQKALQQKDADIAATTTRYETDKARYRALATGGK